MYTGETTKELDNMQFRFTGLKTILICFNFINYFYRGIGYQQKEKYTVDLSELGSCSGTNVIKFRSLDK